METVAANSAVAAQRKATKEEKNVKRRVVSKRRVKRGTKWEKVHAPEQSLKWGPSEVGTVARNGRPPGQLYGMP